MFIDLKSPDGNIFAVVGYAAKYLRSIGEGDKIKPLYETVTKGTYEQALEAVTKATGGYIRYKR